MPLITKKEIRYLVISILVITGAFSLKDISFLFFLQTLILVTIGYGAHVLVHKKISESRGIHMRMDLWPTGLIMSILSGVITGGLAVISIPSIFRRKGSVEKRWMRKSTDMVGGELGYVAMVGVLTNIGIGLVFLYLSNVLTSSVLSFGALINFWIALSSLIPFPSLDGSRIVTWSGWIWGLSLLVTVVGIIGYFIHM